VIAVNAHQIAWTAASCTEANCPLHLTDPTTGTTSTQPLPPGQMPTLGTYSPDGHHLALLLTAASDANASAVEIALLNQATHRLTVIPGTEMDIIPTLTWSTDGRWLLITSLGRQQIGLVNPHTRHLQWPHFPTDPTTWETANTRICRREPSRANGRAPSSPVASKFPLGCWDRPQRIALFDQELPAHDHAIDVVRRWMNPRAPR
jgi:hypothetical protein